MKRGRHYQSHPFEALCKEFGLEHRLTQFYHPWTHGQVERMNRTLKEATIKKYYYESQKQREQHIKQFIEAYHYASQLKVIGFISPVQFILNEYQVKSWLFHSDPNHYFKGHNRNISHTFMEC
jgi:transposase InsO family protein